MSDARGAAERLRRIKAGDEYRAVYGCNCINGGHQQRDTEILADAYLAEHHPDENDAVTSENLMVMFGFEPSIAGDLWMDSVCWLGGDKFAYDGVELQAGTLGEVRTMLNVLKVEVKQ